MNINEQRHFGLLETDPEYRLMEQTGVTQWRWGLYLAVKRLRNALVASFTWPALHRLFR